MFSLLLLHEWIKKKKKTTQSFMIPAFIIFILSHLPNAVALFSIHQTFVEVFVISKFAEETGFIH